MNTRVSVAMAVYNGEKYLHEQLDSIIEMLGLEDEIIISYDESSDKTLSIIEEYQKKDNRIKVVYDKGHSVESNFNSAVGACSGKYIFLSDQDDIWINNKIEKMVEYFERNPQCVILISNGQTVDEKLGTRDDLFELYKTSTNPFRNLIKGTYLGCQMAFRNSIRDRVWPVSVNPPLPHDLWLGVKGSSFGNVDLLNEYLILHRLHENNFSNTSKMKLTAVIRNRIHFIKELLSR